jgi:hypothetical protein
VEAIDESHARADATLVAAIDPEAEGLARAEAGAVIREQADAEARLTAIRIERPRELSGATWQIPFDGQNLYVTVNHDGHMIQEVFATGPISCCVVDSTPRKLLIA